MSRLLDGVKLITGVEVPSPLIMPTLTKVYMLDMESPSLFLLFLRALACSDAETQKVVVRSANQLMMARLRDEDMELINSDDTMDPTIAEIIKATIDVEVINPDDPVEYRMVRAKVHNPLPFPLQELVEFRRGS